MYRVATLPPYTKKSILSKSTLQGVSRTWRRFAHLMLPIHEEVLFPKEPSCMWGESSHCCHPTRTNPLHVKRVATMRKIPHMHLIRKKPLLESTHCCHCNSLQRTATHCNTLQHTATHCNTLQHTVREFYSSLSPYNGFARDSGYERTFSKLPKVIQVPWKLPKQKNFYILIVSSFNQNRLSLRSNVSGGFGLKCRRLPPSRWRCHRK